MSVATPQTPPPPVEREGITIYSHSSLFYWWPVWLIGFLLALLTYFSGHVMAIVPNDSEAKRGWRIVDETTGKEESREGILVKPGKDEKHQHHLPLANRAADGTMPAPDQPHLQVSTNRNFGLLFMVVLLMVIGTTNVPLRGLWTVVVLLVGIVVFLALVHWELLEPVIGWVKLIDIRINLAGYLLLAIGLLIPWLQAFLLWDRQIYIAFSPGQMRVVTAVGSGEQVYDTMGMTVEKQRSDFFRHVFIGLGSGDLIVKTSGAQAHQIELHNVLFVGRKVAQIEEMLRKRNVIESKG